MIEITNGMTAKELMIKLFKNHYLLIKDLTSKLHDGKQYIELQSEMMQITTRCLKH